MSRAIRCSIGLSALTQIALLVPLALTQQRSFALRLHSGQIMTYRVDVSASRKATVESRVSSQTIPPALQQDFSGLFRVEIVEFNSAGAQLRVYVSQRAVPRSGSAASAPPADAPDERVELFLAPNGTASQLKGYDQLSATQRLAFTEWLARFTMGMAFPSKTVRPGQKWTTTEPETTSVPIAGLAWSKKFEYVKDEPCPANTAKESKADESVPNSGGSCAVILVTVALQQKSSRQDSTPQDYKLNNLKTRGSASGKNETILYLSLSNGVLVRSTETAQQFMDVTVALSDGSNQVHYTLGAVSRSEIALISDSP